MKLSQGVHTLLVAGFSLALTACGTVQNYDAAISSWKNAPAEKTLCGVGIPPYHQKTAQRESSVNLC